MDSHVICEYSFYCPLSHLYTFPSLALPFVPAGTASMMFVEKKTPQCKSCRFSFIWGETSPAVWETAFQIALRNCSEEVRGGASICKSFAAEGR